MTRKINALIACSVIVTIILVAINIYLVQTAYEFKKQQFRSEVKDKIAEITENYSGLDSAFFYKKDHLYRTMAQNYIGNNILRSKIKENIIENEYDCVITRKLQRRMEKDFPNLKIDFAIVMDKFVIYNSTKSPDTIYSYSTPSLNNRIIGNLSSLEDAFPVRNYINTITLQENERFKGSDYNLLTEDTLYLTVHGWQEIIFIRMLSILALSILSIITVITIFGLAIKAVIQQKKVSDMKSDFINNITHELKTPLTTLSVSTKILEDKQIKDDDAAYRKLLQTINRQNARLHTLIDQVMLNALGFDEAALQKENTDLEVFLNAIINDFCLGYPDIILTTDFHTSNINFVLDKFHFTTAIVNVLENAVKYGSTNILMVTRLSKNGIIISIKDNGIGIAKSKQHLLFDKFFRIANTTVHDVKGLGLGLYYVKQIVLAHKGTIAVVSDLGKGSLFDITLPHAA